MTDRRRDLYDELADALGCDAMDSHEGRLQRARRLAAESKPRVVGYIVSNGARDRFRCWGQLGPEWTEDRDAALRFARRQDADAFAAEDEDAWAIVPIIES